MTCAIVQPSEIQELGRVLVQLWIITIGGMVLLYTDFGCWYDRLHAHARRRRIRAIHTRKAARHG
ncbi:hypothetical protein MNO14_08230 [Luteimonas sp. S4-F44]|uniref:hypothetical protein n=1 Tax=Luteimonas sp. S4-F44 TaxID=2925842 RepID=UPI001F5336E0|nr:hypothetical protein [Luteimonas sp. S4-F44]UNK44021.1 hypothetical protein MNO14_08230 [Luteimonas sp. S4-F44]